VATERYRVGDLEVDVGTGSVLRNGRRQDLPPLSFALLVSLLRRAPNVARREELLSEVWQDAVVSDETLSQRVRLLRESLGDEVGEPRYVESVRGWGYRIAAPVESLDDSNGPAVGVAVLPFANMSGAPEDDYLCEGLAEEIISALTRIPGLRVIARTSSFAVGQMGLDVRDVGARLSASNVLEGSVRRAGSRVRVTVQLVSAADGSHLWSERYDRELADILDLEDDIADAVAIRLRVVLAEGERHHSAGTVDSSAYDAYLKGRYHFARATPENLNEARACYERAVSSDPTFARAFDAMAELYWWLGFFGGVSPRDAFEQSTWYAVRALELDSSLADTHALLAMLRKELDYNWPEVNRELARSLELNRDSPTVRLRYVVAGLMPHGRLEEALAEIEHVLDSDPLSLFVNWTLGYLAYFARMPERAIATARHMIEIDRSSFLARWVLSVGLEQAGELSRAVTVMRRANELSGGIPFTSGFLALVLGEAGADEEVRRMVDDMTRAAESRYFPPSAIALGHIGLGQWDDAFVWLDKAVDLRDPIVMPVKSYPFLDPVRSDARYHQLLRKMKLDRHYEGPSNRD
jgi:serine/threonine-protein kinase